MRDVQKRKEYLRNYQREWMRKRRQAFFSGKVCANCGGNDRLELDHVDPSQKWRHAVWSYADERRSAEIAKCQVLCHSCHWEKTKHDLGYGVRHGTYHAYRKYGCRCEPCIQAAKARNRLEVVKKRIRRASAKLVQSVKGRSS